MTLSAHLAAARRHLAAVERLSRPKKPTPAPAPLKKEDLATDEEIAACFAKIRAELAEA
jgi:hypothetical protein